MHIPGYQIERELGQGGMAIVYLAMQESLRRPVALKVIKPILTTDEEFAQRFMREGRIIAQLSDPHIVTVYDIASHEGVYYLSMEYLPGDTLQRRIRAGLPLKDALAVARCIAGALHYAHHRSIIHRDIKPQNILFRENGSPVLTDFGIAKTLGGSTMMTRTGLSIGTPRYMSPEQIRGQNVDARADLYSFGVLFYEMLTGSVPYDADDSFALAMMHVTAPIPELPLELRRFQPLINKLLDKDPNQRFQSGEEFIAALDNPEAISFSPLHAAPTPSALLHRPSWKAGALAAILAGMALTGSYLFLRQPDSPTSPTSPTVIAPPTLPTPPTVIAPPTASPPFTDLAAQRRADADQRLAQARQRQQDGALEDSLGLIEQGLQLVPDHSELLALRDQVNRQITDAQTRKVWEEQQQQAKVQADQFLEQAQRAGQEGAFDRSLVHIEQGLQSLPNHPGLLALKDKIQAQRAERLRQEDTVRQPANTEERRKVEAEQRRKKVDESLARALDSQRNRAYETSLLQIGQGLQQAPDDSRLLALRDEVRRQLREAKAAPSPVEPVDRVAALLRECAGYLQANRLTSGKGGNAVDCYSRVLQRDPVNTEARAGLDQVADRYADLATAAVRRGDVKAASSALERLVKLNRGDPRIAGLREQLAEQQRPALTQSATTPPSVEAVPTEPQVESKAPALDLISLPQAQDRSRTDAETQVIAQDRHTRLSKTETSDSVSMQMTVAPQGILDDRSPAEPSDASARPRTADQAWATVKNSSDPVEIEQFLAAYPKSRQVAAARAKLRQLQKQPSAPARLAVQANQDDAEVWINGRNIGTAPLEVDLKPGSYKIRVRREGYTDWNGQVDLKAGDDSTLSAILPKKLDVAAAKPASPPTPTPEPELQRKPEREPEPEPEPEPPKPRAPDQQTVAKATPGQTADCLRGNCENGEGAYRYPDGSEYSGQFRNAKIHGQGTYVYAGRGEKYVGEWRNGVINGQGTYYYRTGNRYTGEWRNGKKQGQGTYLYADRGEKYVGDFANDQPNGQGVYYYSDGDRYEGEWRNGRKHGQGVMYESGIKIVGEWQNDQKVRVTVEP